MGRRWTTNQYMARYFRRLERRAFNRMLDEISHPPSADGSRKCGNCAHNASCTRNRKGNHLNCFRAISDTTLVETKNSIDLEQGETAQTASEKFASFFHKLLIWSLIVLGIVGIIAFLSLGKGAVTILLFILLFVLLFIH